ncbi:MAG: hypothetical protein ACQEQU_03945 [Spirochaetota bacterium]
MMQNHLPRPFVRDEEVFIPLAPEHFPLPKTVMQGSHQPGSILQGGLRREWNWFGVTVIDGYRYVRGMAVDIHPFGDVFTMDEGTALQRIIDLAGCFPNSTHFGLYELYLIEPFGFLMLPPQLSSVVRQTLSQQAVFETEQQWVRPDLSGKEKLVCQFTCLTYKVLTGESPLGSSRVRKDGYQALPINLLRPDLPQQAADWFSQRLGRRPSLDTSLSAWCNSLKRMLEIPKQPAPPDTREELQTFIEKQEKRAKRSEYLRLHRTRNRVLAVVIVVVLATAIPFVRRVLEPPPTAGMDQTEVIAYYYQAHNRLDPTAVEAALSQGAKSSFDQMLTYLHVTESVRQAYEHESGFIPAQQWIEEGKPTLDPSKTVFGITDLHITELGDHTFQAEYTLWTPLPPEKRIAQDTPANALQVTEELTLVQRTDHWVITEVRRTDSDRR